MNLIWIASYPKSGNTWMRAFLAHYLAGKPGPLDINAGLSDGAYSASLFQRMTGVSADLLTPEQVRWYLPEVYERLARLRPGLRVMKTHDAYVKLADDRPLFPDASTRVAIYIVRHPLDVAVSAMAHWDVSRPEAVIQGMARDIWFTPTPGHLPARINTWSRHVESWAFDTKGIPVHVVRYEDMLTDPAATFAGVVRAVGLPLDDARLGQAIDASTFSQLASQERARGFAERVSRTQPFFRGGRSGDGHRLLAPHLIQQVEAAHGPMMRRVGYLR